MTKLATAERATTAANKYAKDAAAQEKLGAGYAVAAAELQQRIVKADLAKAQKDERQRKADLLRAERALATELRRVDTRLATTERRFDAALREPRAPKKEKLRILMLGASSHGDLRVGREQSKIQRAVEAALHRDQIVSTFGRLRPPKTF